MKSTRTNSFIALIVLALAAAVLTGAACQTTGNTNTTVATNVNRTMNAAENVNSMPSNTGNMNNITSSKTAEGTGNIDVQFIDMMLPHHADGIKMAEMAVKKAQNAEVKAFAQKAVSMQREDSQRLEGFRNKFFAGATKADRIEMKGREMTMAEMMKMSQEDMQKLEKASGAEFDRTFLDIFTKHHQMAIDMATEEKNRGNQMDVKADAEKNIDQQTKDIGEMAALKKKVGEK
jgi:uncharacterized protein (DUF305 family)